MVRLYKQRKYNLSLSLCKFNSVKFMTIIIIVIIAMGGPKPFFNTFLLLKKYFTKTMELVNISELKLRSLI